MNFTLIIAGLVFLFNPEINILDLLPDFIGIILIMRGLQPITAVSPAAGDSYRNFSRYLAVSAVKTAALLPAISVASTDPTFYMLFTLVFAVVGLIFAIPAFAGLYETVSDSAMYAGVTLPRGFRPAAAFTPIFLLIRSFLALAPELVYLYVIQEDTAAYPLAPYKPAMTMICMTVGLILGLIWLICTSRMFGNLKKSRKLALDITRRISEVPVTLAGTVKKAVPRMTALVTVSAFFTIPFCIDGFPVLPLAVASVLMIFASRQAEILYGPAVPRMRRISVISSVFSILSLISTAIFTAVWQKQAALSIRRLYLQFSVPAVLRLVSSIAFAAVLIRAGELLKKTIREHTGSPDPLPSEGRERENLAQKADLAMKIGAVLMIVSGAVSYILLYNFPIYQIFSSAASLVWAGYISKLMSQIVSGVRERYPD